MSPTDRLLVSSSQFIQHQQALGGRAGGAEGEQRQADGGPARVHRQRQTVETAAGGVPGGGREAAQTGISSQIK